MKRIAGKVDNQIRRFGTCSAWEIWLEKNHSQSPGLWLRLAKKGSDLPSLTYPEALEVALCYGWIDGQKRGESDRTWLQRFVPRSGKSMWSKINRQKAEALIAKGKMKPAGLEAIEAAKTCGRWESAYDSPKGSKIPPDFQSALDADPRAREFFARLDAANRYALLFRIQTAKKAETRARKIVEFIAMLKRHERLHAPRPARKTSP